MEPTDEAVKTWSTELCDGARTAQELSGYDGGSKYVKEKEIESH